jgi:hypothetical protein
MAEGVIGLDSVSKPVKSRSVKNEDKDLKTGNLKRSYNMANECSTGQVWNASLKKCVSKNKAQQKAIKRKAEQKTDTRVRTEDVKRTGDYKKKLRKMKKSPYWGNPGAGSEDIFIE